VDVWKHHQAPLYDSMVPDRSCRNRLFRQVFGAVAGDFLPKIMPGILGIFLAALLASVMSSCDAFMIASSALFTENIYRPLSPDRPQRHYVTVGRIAAVFVVSGGVVFAFWLPGVVAGLEIFWKVSAMMGLAFWMGLFWRRTTVAGAWATTLVSFAVLLFTSNISFGQYVLWDFNAGCAQYLPDFMLWNGQLYLPWQMILYLSAGLISGIVVSLFTKPVAKEKLDNYYALIRTPIKPTNLEFMIPSRTSVVGFLIGWAFVAVIVVTVYLIASA